MDITPELSEGAPLISRYGGGGFTVGGVRYEGGIVIDTLGAVHSCSAFSLQALRPAISGDLLPELVLLGTGSQMQMPPADIRQQLESQHIGYEMMETGAACRSFNVLLAEGRRVAALLLAV